MQVPSTKSALGTSSFRNLNSWCCFIPVSSAWWSQHGRHSFCHLMQVGRKEWLGMSILKKLFVVYLKYEVYWLSCILICYARQCYCVWTAIQIQPKVMMPASLHPYWYQVRLSLALLTGNQLCLERNLIFLPHCGWAGADDEFWPVKCEQKWCMSLLGQSIELSVCDFLEFPRQSNCRSRSGFGASSILHPWVSIMNWTSLLTYNVHVAWGRNKT